MKVFEMQEHRARLQLSLFFDLLTQQFLPFRCFSCLSISQGKTGNSTLKARASRYAERRFSV